MNRQVHPVVAVLLLLGMSAWTPALANSPPDVSNVTASQRQDASKVVDIHYDLADADDDVCAVTVLASDDGGVTWDVPISALSGDVGSGVTPGTGKHIVWNPAADIPGESGSNFKVRVCATDSPPIGGMVLIPGGEFAMGCHAETGEDCQNDELPVHDVYVDSFSMSVYETTNDQYCAYLNSALAQGLIDNPDLHSGVVYKAGDSEAYCDTTTSESYSSIVFSGGVFTVTSGREDHPMVLVSWYGAAAYANWRSSQEDLQPSYNLDTWECNWDTSGYRLPTEAEWEYAARGGNHDPYYAYPWGNSIDGSNANYSGSGDPYESVVPGTTPVGYYPANDYGLYDMAGNVWELCHDWYDDNYYYSYPYDNPHGPETGSYRVIRSGSWLSVASVLRCPRRGKLYPDRRDIVSGFRLALDS